MYLWYDFFEFFKFKFKTLTFLLYIDFCFKQSFLYKLFSNILINYKGKTINVCTMSIILHWTISLHYKTENQNIWSSHTVEGHVILLISAHFYLAKWESCFLSICGTQSFYKVIKNNIFLVKVVYFTWKESLLVTSKVGMLTNCQNMFQTILCGFETLFCSFIRVLHFHLLCFKT